MVVINFAFSPSISLRHCFCFSSLQGSSLLRVKRTKHNRATSLFQRVTGPDITAPRCSPAVTSDHGHALKTPPDCLSPICFEL